MLLLLEGKRYVFNASPSLECLSCLVAVLSDRVSGPSKQKMETVPKYVVGKVEGLNLLKFRGFFRACSLHCLCY